MFRAISYGGGVQSTAMIVLACTGRIEADVALFANVGDRAEHPATLTYVHDIAVPWAASHGFDVIEVRRRETGSKRVDLFDTLMTTTSGNVSIPARAPNGYPMKRTCTASWKVEPIHEWLRDHGHIPAVSLLGISVDEIERAGRGNNDDKRFPRAYPLLDLRLTRADCEQVIRDAGLPVPPKSACYFCPYHRRQVWAEMRRDEPDLFDRAQDLEDALIARRTQLGMTPVYLTDRGRRLTDAIAEAQPSLFGEGIGDNGCDEGVCFV